MYIPARFERFVLRIRVSDSPLLLPVFKGATLRGAFGEVFKKAVCVFSLEHSCLDCTSSSCPYRDIFETADEAGRSVPRPFVMEPPEDTRQEINCGESMEFSIVLFGRALGFLPVFIMVFDEIGHRGFGINRTGKYVLEEVTTDGGTIIYEPGKKLAVPEGHSVSEYSIPGNRSYRLTIDFVTPVQIREGGMIVKPRFSDIVASLMRRLKLLYRFHSSERIPQEVVDALEVVAARAIEETDFALGEVRRYSRRQGRKIDYRGFVGKVSASGDVSQLYPWLMAGSYLHIGKGCTFGLGRYNLAVV